MWSANEIADWFLVRHSSEMERDEGVDENLTQMKLHKLMYYAQGVSLAILSSRLFDEDLLAWKHGPVVKSIYDRFQGIRDLDDTVDNEQIAKYEEIANDQNSRMILEAVYEQYGGFSAGQLRNMTHAEQPWIEAWDKGAGSSVMEDASIKKYFEENIVEI